MATVLDFSAAIPSASAIKSAGHDGAVMYISPAREAWMGAKPVHRPTIDDFDTHGLQAALVWQYGKEKQPDVMRGWDGGVADAKAAQEHLESIQCAGHPVYFAVDFDITLDQWNNTAVEYFKGAASILGKQRVGIYGHSRVLAWAKEDDVVATVEPGRILGWQTKSWSNGVKADSYAVLYQGTHNVPGPDGVQVDVNEVLHPEWGWRALDSYQQPQKEESAVSAPTILDWTSRFTFGRPRDVNRLIGVCIHTTENDPTTPAENVATYQINSESGSYHVLADREKLLRENTDDWQTWSTGNQGNDLLLHLSFVFRAHFSRTQWLAEETMLRNGAWQVAQWLKKYGWPNKRATVAQLPGVTTHDDTRVWGGTDHTDPGPNFPWDVFLRYVDEAMLPTSTDLKNEELELSDIDKRRIELTMDQLAGPGKNDKGEPNFHGWDYKSVLAAAKSNLGKGLGLTLVQQIALVMDGQEQQQAQVAELIAAIKGEK